MNLAAMIETLWPLSESFEWAAELGVRVQRQRPEWWQQAPAEIRRLRLAQARGYAFLRWLESGDCAGCGRRELQTLLTGLVAAGQRHEWFELAASFAQQVRPGPAVQTSSFGEPPVLDGEPIAFYADPFCLTYPGYGDLEVWTEEAFRGGRVEWRLPEPAGNALLAGAHDQRYLRELFAWGRAGGGLLTPETAIDPSSERALRAASGATLAALKAAMAGERRPVFSFARPGSHHAGYRRAGGTCLVNHLAVAAATAAAEGARVAVLDLDAHHGNGTEEIFLSCEKVLTVSVHQAQPFFPGTGDSAQGQANLNVEVAPGTSWRGALEQALRRLAAHRPDVVLVELSTDAHIADPVSALAAGDADFAFAAQALRELQLPVVYELGASMSERAWVGGLRSIVKAR